SISTWRCFRSHPPSSAYAFFLGFVSRSKYVNPINGKQTTKSVGVRWDLHPSLALKAQWDVVDTHGTIGKSFNIGSFRPGFDGKANVFAVALDFVF
ncbi:hypothetical protein, partial [Xanthomonas arboricola]